MTWLIWRVHRIEILAVVAGALLVSLGLMVGTQIAASVNAELAAQGCDTARGLAPSGRCSELLTRSDERLQPFRWLAVSLVFLPALVGSFIGGPLFAREIERGTHRLIWTQAVGRVQWAGAKLLILLGVTALAALAVSFFGGLAAALRMAWMSPATRFATFDFEGPAPVSYAVFAVAVCAFIGALSRRVLAGMLVGLLLFVVLRAGVTMWVRPFYEPPIMVVASADAPMPWPPVPEGAWIVRTDHVDREGRVVAYERMRELLATPPKPEPGRPFHITVHLAQHGVFARVGYHPADRYGRFQWTEALLFLTLSGALSAGTLLLLRRRDA